MCSLGNAPVKLSSLQEFFFFFEHLPFPLFLLLSYLIYIKINLINQSICILTSLSFSPKSRAVAFPSDILLLLAYYYYYYYQSAPIITT